MALTQEQLDELGCEVPGCDHSSHNDLMYLHSRCHTGAGLRVAYDKQTGLLHVMCSQCETLLVEIEVAA